MSTGTFTLSLDFELLWGTVDKRGQRFARACRIEREQVVWRLLEVLAQHEVSATWCVVGHLMLDSCPQDTRRKHEEIVRPTHAWVQGDWFDHDPGGDERSAPLHFAPSLVEAIQRCRVAQEIGSHSFSHVIFGDRGCSRATAESELRACLAAARARGIELRSFVFPRNSVGHLDVLRESGIVCFRGPEPSRMQGAPATVQRLARALDVLRAAEPPVVHTSIEQGLVNVPASMIYLPMHGLRRHIPLALRVQRAKRGLDAACREGGIFHLWFHPTNLADELETMFDGLRQILRRVAELRAAGRLEVKTMGQIADATLRGTREAAA